MEAREDRDLAGHVSAGRSSGSDHLSTQERGRSTGPPPPALLVPTQSSDLQGVQAPQPPEGSGLDLSDSVKAKIPVKRQETRL